MMRRRSALIPLRPWLPWALALATTALGGCARRTALRPAELERVEAQASLSPLRVYPERRMVFVYDGLEDDQRYHVQKEIVTSTDRDRIKTVVTRNTAGAVLEVDELNGARLLWVTFDPSCRDSSCAFGFVETEKGQFLLASAPRLEGHEPAKVYRSHVASWRRLKPGKLASLAEANRVYVARTRSGKVLTLSLEVKKREAQRTHTKTRRSRGID